MFYGLPDHHATEVHKKTSKTILIIFSSQFYLLFIVSNENLHILQRTDRVSIDYSFIVNSLTVVLPSGSFKFVFIIGSDLDLSILFCDTKEFSITELDRTVLTPI